MKPRITTARKLGHNVVETPFDRDILSAETIGDARAAYCRAPGGAPTYSKALAYWVRWRVWLARLRLFVLGLFGIRHIRIRRTTGYFNILIARKHFVEHQFQICDRKRYSLEARGLIARGERRIGRWGIQIVGPVPGRKHTNFTAVW